MCKMLLHAVKLILLLYVASSTYAQDFNPCSGEFSVAVVPHPLTICRCLDARRRVPPADRLQRLGRSVSAQSVPMLAAIQAGGEDGQRRRRVQRVRDAWVSFVVV